MTRKLLLILSDKNRKTSDFLVAPFSLLPEQFRVTTPDNLIFMGLNNFAAIIIDSQKLIFALRKVSLGIRDEPATEGLWNIFSGVYNIPVFVLTERKSAASKTMKDLGIEFILNEEIRELFNSNALHAKDGSDDTSAQKPYLTADEIRLMYRNGKESVPQGTRLTNWATEVADSLGMNIIESRKYFLVNLASLALTQIKSIAPEIADLGNIPEVYFIISPTVMAGFSSIFPSFRKKMVSPTIHWAEKGAFTGELAAEMIADAGCFGAILPSKAPYCDQDNLNLLLKSASKHDLQLFSTFTLANNSACDIIATDNSTMNLFVPVYSSDLYSDKNVTRDSYAIIADYKFFEDKLL
jgi:hypothetical protein